MQTAYPNILDKNGKLIKFATVRGPWPRVIETLEGTLDDLLAGGYQTVSVTVMILRLSASRYPRNAALIELLILDVDGVLTDGRLTTASGGESAKSFYVQDGCAIKLWQRCGGKVAILSGRSSEAVTRRATELAIEWVHLAVTDKLSAYDDIVASTGCDDAAVAYLGDDLPDVGPMLRCGFPVAVANAVPAVKRASLYVTRRGGGEGAVAEVVELLLRKQKRWSRALFTQL